MSDVITLIRMGSFKMPTQAQARAHIKDGLKVIMLNVESDAKRNASQRPGPRVQTGRLRSSIVGKVTETSGALTGVLGSNVVYSRILELGGIATIKAHKRMMRKAFGRPVKNPREIDVGEYTVDRRAYPYLRPAIVSPKAQHMIAAELSKAIKEAVSVS